MKMSKSKIALAGSTLLMSSMLLSACSSSEPPRGATTAQQSDAPPVAPSHSAASQHQPAADDHGHDHGHSAAPGAAPRVPAYASAKEAKALPPTLPPAQFVGQAREAYQKVREMPQTIAQLPCYCYCDEGFGHKSLHSCFVDNHASQCAVCVEEALLAYKLQKEEKLTPEQIRERITAEYGQQH